jgi:hypothetical protein
MPLWPGLSSTTRPPSAAVFNLPAALVGMEFYFYVLSAFALRINPDGTEPSGCRRAASNRRPGSTSRPTPWGEYVHIICAKAGQWETLDYRGT